MKIKVFVGALAAAGCILIVLAVAGGQSWPFATGLILVAIAAGVLIGLRAINPSPSPSVPGDATVLSRCSTDLQIKEVGRFLAPPLEPTVRARLFGAMLGGRVPGVLAISATRLCIELDDVGRWMGLRTRLEVTWSDVSRVSVAQFPRRPRDVGELRVKTIDGRELHAAVRPLNEFQRTISKLSLGGDRAI